MLRSFLASFFAVLLCSCITINPIQASTLPLMEQSFEAPIPSKERESRKVTYKLGMIPHKPGAYCGGTAVGPRALLTADHCTVHIPGNVVLLDGRAAVVQEVLVEDMDHAIIVFKDKQFDTWATIAQAPEVGDEIFIWGNSLFDSFLRRGYVTTYVWNQPFINWPSGIGFMVIDLRVSGGDSGSGIFDRRGRLVGVVTGSVAVPRSASGFGVALPFAFDTAKIRRYVPEPRYLAAPKKPRRG